MSIEIKGRECWRQDRSIRRGQGECCRKSQCPCSKAGNVGKLHLLKETEKGYRKQINTLFILSLASLFPFRISASSPILIQGLWSESQKRPHQYQQQRRQRQQKETATHLIYAPFPDFVVGKKCLSWLSRERVTELVAQIRNMPSILNNNNTECWSNTLVFTILRL